MQGVKLVFGPNWMIFGFWLYIVKLPALKHFFFIISEKLLNLDLLTFEQGGIFIVPHPMWHGLRFLRSYPRNRPLLSLYFFTTFCLFKIEVSSYIITRVIGSNDNKHDLLYWLILLLPQTMTKKIFNKKIPK